ncbi:hypothetical protein GIB67_035667 [Kingdonia uniflora]|uniref:Serpin domain-containing protein n=1 Tax=Kingdonia uniflora TaxID=39325 RepID=A0A7J7KVC0_9MAGN|nr:hypothetical protein GIB67_035667 [Kingdonia uniflora]
MDHTTHSLDSDSAVADTAGNIPSRASSSSRRRGPSRESKPLPDGKKKKVGVNSWGQPIRGVNSYSTTVGTLTCNQILINYKKFTNVPDKFIHIVKTELELTFDLRRVANFSIMRRMNDAWKRYKSRLNKKYIKGKDPAKVKATPPPFVPKEVWVEFVDMCNSDAFQAQSKKNIENCNKVKVACTTGRTSMAVVRHNLVVERNVLDQDVGRADVFIKAHSKADETYQCPEMILFSNIGKMWLGEILNRWFVRKYSLGTCSTPEALKKLKKLVNNRIVPCLQFLESVGMNGAKDLNFVYSPLSMQLALSLLASGSKGETLKQTLSFLNFESLTDLNHVSSQLLYLVNSSIEEGPISSCIGGGEEVRSQVNKWAEKATNGLINSILPLGSITNQTRFVLANALYFKGIWDTKFDKSRTKYSKFYLLDGSFVKVPFMTNSYRQIIYSFSDFKVLRLCYKLSDDNNQLSMYIILPHKKDGLWNLVKKARSDPEFVKNHISDLYSYARTGKFMIPKFKISYGFEAKKALKEGGLNLPFSDVAELGGMVKGLLPNENLPSGTASRRMLKPEKLVDFVADHPFMFMVVERNVPDQDVGRADVFIKAHIKADETYQCPEMIEKLQENMNLYPDSNKIGLDDVLTKTLGKHKKGHMMAMGIDNTPSFVANAIHILEENKDLKATNNELKTMLLNMRKDLDDHIKKTLRKQSNLNRECKLNGSPEGIVAYVIVADVSPDAYCHNKQLGDGYYKIEIFNVINGDALLFRQDSFAKTMGDVALDYIGKRGSTVGVTKEKRIKYAKEILQREMLPHVGVGEYCETKKAYYFGYIIHRLLGMKGNTFALSRDSIIGQYSQFISQGDILGTDMVKIRQALKVEKG